MNKQPIPVIDSIDYAFPSLGTKGRISSLKEHRLTVLDIIPVLLFTLLVGTYFVMRYSGLWAENDTAVLTSAVRDIIQSGHIYTTNTTAIGLETSYSNGYAYQAIASMMVMLTGFDPAFLQQIILPFAIVLLAVPVCLLFYEITGLRRTSVIGAILLFTQPEFLFVVLRGSHEKFGRLFMVLALFLLLRSYKSRQNLGAFSAYVGLFYLALFGLLSSNILIGFSFIAAIFFGLIAGMLLQKLRLQKVLWLQFATNRLVLIVPASFILAYLLLYYFYPPMQQSLAAFSGIYGKLMALLLGIEAPSNIYGGVLNAWVDPSVYLLVNLPNLLVFSISVLIWFWQGYNWVIRRHPPKSRPAWLLWLLYGSFGLQAVFSILVDASGGIFNNIQYRLFPSFSILGVAIVANALGGKKMPAFRSRFASSFISVIVAILAALALIKATNEASLVNYWTFYTRPEIEAVGWIDSNAQNSHIWVGFTYRLGYAWQMTRGQSVSMNNFGSHEGPGILNFLVSDWILQEGLRVGQPLPNLNGFLKIYDNGSTQLYHRRAQSAYQH